jgi:hypothetical protein
MASKPTVTLTLAGDEKKLTEAFEKVGTASKTMAEDVGRSSKDMSDAGESGLGGLADKADGAEGKFIGFTDSLSGLQGAFQGLTDDSLSFGERLGMLGQAGADLAGGMASFLIPALASMKATLVTSVIPAVWGFTAALLANPITWIVVGIMALIAAIVLMVVHWDKVKAAVSGVITWIKNAWNGLVGWFSGIGAAIGRALGSIGGFVSSVFKGAVNLAIDAVNWMIDRVNSLIAGVNHINPFEDIPSIPKLKRMHGGGEVPGMIGSEQMIIAQAGERLVPRGQGGNSGGATITFAGNTDTAFATAFQKLVRTGAIQIRTS